MYEIPDAVSMHDGRQHERQAAAQYENLHKDMVGADLIELPPGAVIPHLCHIVLMRGSVSSACGGGHDDSGHIISQSCNVRQSFFSV